MDVEEIVRKMMNSIIDEEWNALDMVVATTILHKAAMSGLERDDPSLFEMINKRKRGA